MGYTTEFEGKIELSKQLTLDDYNFLHELNDCDYRDMQKIGLKNHPDSYCQWVPTKDGRAIVWDGNEKFYQYVEWLRFLIEDFFKPKGYVLNGILNYQGEEIGDMGRIYVEENEVRQIKANVEDIIKCPNCGHQFRN